MNALPTSEFHELLIDTLRQIAEDAGRLTSGNIAHRAQAIKANAVHLMDLTFNQEQTQEKEA